MTGQPTKSDRGEWYLKLLGIETKGGPTTLQEVSHSETNSKTTSVVNDMWQQTSELAPVDVAEDPLSGWEPSELSTAASSRRSVRWPIVILATLLGVIAAFALWWMPQVSDQRVSNHADLMRTSLMTMHGDLAEVQQALALATEPGSESADLGLVAISLAGVADSAARLLDVANQAVPSPLPLTAQEPFDDLAAARTGLEPMAAEATAIRGEIADIADYRLALSRVLAVAELPITADSATITQQGADLARALADSVAALTSMPTAGPFEGHRSLVETEITDFAQWQDDYLNALRTGDAATAEGLIETLHTNRQNLVDQVVMTLAALRTDIDGRILALARQVSRSATGLG
ncbi:MAG: hypothetical protein GY720_03495 [bacterium]|nr:hypothetical protein [bacterium]